MNSDDKLECLRLAVETMKNENFPGAQNILERAKHFYDWVYEREKPNSLTFEKINPERK